MPPNETLGYLMARLSTGLKRRFNKEVCLTNPDQRALHDRLEALDPGELLHQPVTNARFVVVDTETTGLRAYAGDEIVSIAMLEMEALELTGREYRTLVNPGRPIPSETTEIHGIRREDVADSPTIMDLLPGVVEFIRSLASNEFALAVGSSGPNPATTSTIRTMSVSRIRCLTPA